MKIQIFNGSIEFSEGTINRHMSRQEFLQCPIGSSAKQVVVSGPSITYNFSPESGLACNVIFRDDRLHQLLMLMRIPTDDTPEWTVEVELERKLKHDQWLRAELGKPPYDYAWGNVTSEFDPRGCVSEIIVSYSDSRSATN